MRRIPAFVSMVAVLWVGCGSDTPAPMGCIEGMTIACACVDGRTGAQACEADGTYGACTCAGSEHDAGEVAVDAGVPGDDSGTADAGSDDAGSDDAGIVAPSDGGGCPAPYSACALGCFDLMTDEDNCGACDDGSGSSACADGQTCTGGVCVAGCPAPFVLCGGECIDPRTNGAYCGASGTCTGRSAGVSCGSSTCSDGRCVGRSCLDLFRRGFSTVNGLYFVDPDGGGPLGASEVYCDMTTDGGGWTLVYKVRNDVHRLLDPWFPMVGLGSGTSFPRTIDAPASGSFEGPTQATRQAFAAAIAGGAAVESRATLRDGATTLFDIKTLATDVIGAFSLGRDISSSTCAGSRTATGTVIANGLGMDIPAGHTGGRLCHEVSISPGGGSDWAYYGVTSPSASFNIYGDTMLGFDESHTLFWIRERRAD